MKATWASPPAGTLGNVMQRNIEAWQARILSFIPLNYSGSAGTSYGVLELDDTLQRLLDAEMRAERIAQQAEAERENVIQGALMEARAGEDRFTARIPELHRAFIKKSEERAEQTVAELKRRYDERHAWLRDMAEQREDEALEAAFEVLIAPEL